MSSYNQPRLRHSHQESYNMRAHSRASVSWTSSLTDSQRSVYNPRPNSSYTACYYRCVVRAPCSICSRTITIACVMYRPSPGHLGLHTARRRPAFMCECLYTSAYVVDGGINRRHDLQNGPHHKQLTRSSADSDCWHAQSSRGVIYGMLHGVNSTPKIEWNDATHWSYHTP